MDTKLVFELFRDFLDEAFDVLKVAPDRRLECRAGVVMLGEKVSPVYVDENKKICYIFPMFFTMMSGGKYTPTPIRLKAYSVASRWLKKLSTGRLREESEDDFVTSLAIATIKGLQLFRNGVQQDLIFPKVREKVYQLTGLRIEKRTGVMTNGTSQTFAAINLGSAARRYGKHLDQLAEAERVERKPLSTLTEGEPGTATNPFENVDEAARFITAYEKRRLADDAFRAYITDLPYFADLEHRIFRISWASPYVALTSCRGMKENGFVVNQLQSGRFNLKPCLSGHKFLFRGQAEYYSPCVPNMFRKHDEDYFLKYNIFSCEMQLLLDSHPLVRLFNKGFELFNDYFRFEVNYGGLSQHYYNKTQFLDLTSSIDAAKFFAVTTFDFDNNKYVPYAGDKLGVLYFYDIEPDAFVPRKGAGYQLSTIGKQPFMRSGAQHGYLLAMEHGLDFNTLKQVRCVFFKHDKAITQRIYDESCQGEIYQSDDILQHYWYNKLTDPVQNRTVCMEAVDLNHKYNPKTSKDELLRQLKEADVVVHNNGVPTFSEDALDRYYFKNVRKYWADFCQDVYFFSPEGRVLRRHFINLPDDSRFRQYFYR